MCSAEGLKAFLVTNYKEIEDKIQEGTTNRSIAATHVDGTRRPGTKLDLVAFYLRLLRG